MRTENSALSLKAHLFPHSRDLLPLHPVQCFFLALSALSVHLMQSYHPRASLRPRVNEKQFTSLISSAS